MRQRQPYRSIRAYRPRRPRHPKRRRSAAGRVLLWVLAALCAVLAVCRCIDARFDPILDELAEYEARAAVAQAVQGAVDAHMQSNAALYTELYRLQTDAAGEVRCVTADTAAMNAARLSLTAQVDAALAGLPTQRRRIPLGTLTGFSLLNSLGPGWLLTFRPEAYAQGELAETAESLAVNRVRYTAAVKLHITINMVLDGKNRVLTMDSSVPLASVLVRGDVPLYYGG